MANDSVASLNVEDEDPSGDENGDEVTTNWGPDSVISKGTLGM